MHISPRSPCGTVWSGSSTEWISIRVSGKGMPMDPSLLVPVMGLQVATGEVSERPYPSTSAQPDSASKFFLTWRGGGAPPEMQNLMEERSYFPTCGYPLIPVYMVGTPGNRVGLSLIHISEPTRRTPISYAVFCLKKKKNKHTHKP